MSRCDHGDGYFTVLDQGRHRLEHIVVAERALGRPLPAGAEVHHVDGDRGNNEPRNLVICPSRAYHALLHQRERAFDACGHADWRKCSFCGQYDDPANLYIPPRPGKGTIEHRACGRPYRAARKAA